MVAYLFEVPVHVFLVSLCQVTVQQGRGVAGARINQASVVVVFVRFNATNNDFPLLVVIAVLVTRMQLKWS